MLRIEHRNRALCCAAVLTIVLSACGGESGSQVGASAGQFGSFSSIENYPSVASAVNANGFWIETGATPPNITGNYTVTGTIGGQLISTQVSVTNQTATTLNIVETNLFPIFGAIQNPCFIRGEDVDFSLAFVHSIVVDISAKTYGQFTGTVVETWCDIMTGGADPFTPGGVNMAIISVLVGANVNSNLPGLAGEYEQYLLGTFITGFLSGS